MRVVLLNQYYAPDEAATAQILADLGAGLARQGHRVRAVCASRAYADPRVRYPRRETIDGVEIRRTWASGFGRGRNLGRMLDYLTFLVGAAGTLAFQRRPDVVISLSTPPMIALLGLMLAKLRRARSVYWVMDIYPDLAFELGALERGSLVGRLLGRCSRLLLERSDSVVALGETMAGKLRAGGAGRVAVVHNWADGEVIRPRPVDSHVLRRDWGWDGRFVVLYSGNMGLAHEFDTVLDAAEILRDEPRVLFAFVGQGPRRAEVEERASQRGLPNVEFRPYVPREALGESLGSGDVHLVTLRPGMPGLLVPSKIYGILAAGRPTLYVGPGEGEIADILGQGRCGTSVVVGDGEGLAAAVRRYLADDDLTQTHGRNAREIFDRRFTKEHGLSAFARLIGNDAA